ncbi:protealysin inhibitor emfourin [Zobellia sp. B3R18]|uniref:protealysin inhibitor emfourin n=1 Tax=Zobellia sp. B3R18 TaxID=2841568 RepID=UPI001C078E9B|nr:protealysin inhibitor emfourin [Zobellia sp. B3R18]MBU2973037.1 hypothetical protein [Zobellia sp. B3R18]
MKYHINIEGGFTGISRQFEGEIDLDKAKEEEMLNALAEKQEINSQIRDGFTYTVKLMDNNGVYESQFNESNLPSSLRTFITDIQKGNN